MKISHFETIQAA